MVVAVVRMWRVAVGLILLVWVNGAPTPGHVKKEFTLTEANNFTLETSSALDKGGHIRAYIDFLCPSDNNANVQVSWVLRLYRTPCAIPTPSRAYVEFGDILVAEHQNKHVFTVSSSDDCGSHPTEFDVKFYFPGDNTPPPISTKLSTDTQAPTAAPTTPTSAPTTPASAPSTRRKRKVQTPKPQQIYDVKETCVYTLSMTLKFNGSDAPKRVYNISGQAFVEMRNTHEYLSSLDYPLWQLYAGLVGIYSFYALLWLILMAMNWTDLIRLQYWIGAVVALGMIEKCVFFNTYDSIKKYGLSTNLLIFAHCVSCLKRTLARVLVIVASTGFGIVKPRLGPVLNKVLALGVVYFALCGLEGYFDATNTDIVDSQSEVLVKVPIIVLDAGICYWILLSLVGTMRALRVRQNNVKLALYRHFTVAILASVAISVVFLIWSLYLFNSGKCVKDWHEIWLKDGFWHILFCILLLVIMIIWRPSNNKARYAYSPVSDVDTEEMEQMPSEAFEGMKLRSMKSGEEKDQRRPNSAEDDLKWVEEHIPSGVDAALPSLLDSDEELMTTKFEMSKLD